MSQLLYQTVASGISGADVFEAWRFYLILIVLFSLVAAYRIVDYSSAVIYAFIITILSLVFQLLVNDPSGPCPHYGSYGYYITIAIISLVYAGSFYGKSGRRMMISLSFVLLAMLSLCLTEKNVIRDTYRVVFEGKEVFKTI
jgi:hypothetical protein